jgi:hypothetical protein
VKTDGSGLAVFTATLTFKAFAPHASGAATDPSGNTCELGNCR